MTLRRCKHNWRVLLKNPRILQSDDTSHLQHGSFSAMFCIRPSCDREPSASVIQLCDRNFPVENDTRKYAAKTRGRPFAPGNAGRPRGSRNRTTLAAETLLDGEA